MASQQEKTEGIERRMSNLTWPAFFCSKMSPFWSKLCPFPAACNEAHRRMHSSAYSVHVAVDARPL